MQLQFLTSPMVSAHLTQDARILVPIGSTEQHGWMGLVGTDALLAEAVAARAGDKLNVIVAPPITIGMAQHHLAFAGTISLRPTTLIMVIRDVIASLLRGGFRTVVFVNGHGGNVATVHAAFSEVMCEFSLRTPPAHAACCLELHNFYEGTSFRARAEALYGLSEGQHVTASEVAMTQCLFPAHFAGRIGIKETPQVAPAASGFYDAEDYRRRYPDGRIASDPSLSRPGHGAELLDCAVEDLVARVNELRAT